MLQESTGKSEDSVTGRALIPVILHPVRCVPARVSLITEHPVVNIVPIHAALTIP